MREPNGNQRWEEGRALYRPPSETIRTSEYEVAVISDDTTARTFVETHHYSRAYPAARYRFGLYRHGELVGVAVFSQPCNNLALTNVFSNLTHLEGVELGRFVLLDEVPGNGETWFLARCFELLKGWQDAPNNWDHDARPWAGVRGVLSFSDPQPRMSQAGELVFPGHIGTIYQASNALYLGRGKARTLRLMPGGHVVFSDRAAQKIRKKEKGWAYSSQLLLEAGAPALPCADPSPAELAAWLKQAQPAVTSPVRHKGNHRYAWVLDRKADKRLWKGLRSEAAAYPKQRDAA